MNQAAPQQEPPSSKDIPPQERKPVFRSPGLASSARTPSRFGSGFLSVCQLHGYWVSAEFSSVFPCIHQDAAFSRKHTRLIYLSRSLYHQARLGQQLNA